MTHRHRVSSHCWCIVFCAYDLRPAHCCPDSEVRALMWLNQEFKRCGPCLCFFLFPGCRLQPGTHLYPSGWRHAILLKSGTTKSCCHVAHLHAVRKMWRLGFVTRALPLRARAPPLSVGATVALSDPSLMITLSIGSSARVTLVTSTLSLSESRWTGPLLPVASLPSFRPFASRNAPISAGIGTRPRGLVCWLEFVWTVYWTVRMSVLPI